jgi:hypothetical protein
MTTETWTLPFHCAAIVISDEGTDLTPPPANLIADISPWARDEPDTWILHQMDAFEQERTP